MIATALDSLLSRTNGAGAAWPPDTRLLDTPAGRIRVRDIGGAAGAPVVLMTPDGPNVIEHHADLIERLRPHARVVCFEMPGWGFSQPYLRYDHSPASGGAAILSLMDTLGIQRAALAFSCGNGFHAIAAAKLAPARVTHLVLAQTPGLSAMPGWAVRNVPKPLRVPVVGQAVNRAARRKLAHAWYSIAINDKAQRDAYRAVARRALDDGACFCLAGAVQALPRIRANDLTGVKTPAFMLWGDSDRSHKHTHADSLLELLPQATIRHAPGCGHFPDLEQPTEYAEALLGAIA
ncbi:MAG TPA: alpha/beta hydrolase [Verrucomicrobiae bacterium]|nr:alpha/beta hydrolase [Verrucomicrobiae bacterium]